METNLRSVNYRPRAKKAISCEHQFATLGPKQYFIIKRSLTLPKKRFLVLWLVTLLSIPTANATTRTVVNVNSSGAGSLRDTVAGVGTPGANGSAGRGFGGGLRSNLATNT